MTFIAGTITDLVRPHDGIIYVVIHPMLIIKPNDIKPGKTTDNSIVICCQGRHFGFKSVKDIPLLPPFPSLRTVRREGKGGRIGISLIVPFLLSPLPFSQGLKRFFSCPSGRVLVENG